MKKILFAAVAIFVLFKMYLHAEDERKNWPQEYRELQRKVKLDMEIEEMGEADFEDVDEDSNGLLRRQ